MTQCCRRAWGKSTYYSSLASSPQDQPVRQNSLDLTLFCGYDKHHTATSKPQSSQARCWASNSLHATFWVSSVAAIRQIHQWRVPWHWVRQLMCSSPRYGPTGQNVGKRGDNEETTGWSEGSEDIRGCSVRQELIFVIGAGKESSIRCKNQAVILALERVSGWLV